MKAGITGHQNLGAPETVAWVEKTLQEVIAQNLIRHGFTSLAIGADQLFAEILHDNGIPYTAVLPCREIERTFQTPAHLENYRRLLRTAAGVETLNFIEPAETAYMEAGKRVVDLSDLVIAVWNGRPAKGLGGTADAVRYALDQKKRVVHINPLTRQVSKL
ncbi:MAG: hypothetical protein ONB44_16775 [candidate division KSB1 bacterium]|nr:hypothetical protein [candidate division KSB1 bacterium]MDZ7303790.1 hypothetical protein [candidate division KSB1 bacterium]MDZ7313049.1 hypothetical protein [candidate division KSB1 bacterium]